MARKRSDRNRYRNRDPNSLYNMRRDPKLKKALESMMHPTPRRYYSRYRKRPSTSELLAEDERDFSGTPVVAVYVVLPSEIINEDCELVVNPDELRKQLTTLKSVKVDGVAVNIWWGIVEANNPREYNWEGYRQLFQIVRESGFTMEVVMSFHECVGDGVRISLPKWIKEIGVANPDIYFTDIEGRRNTETLTWGIDKEPVLRGRTAVEVYSDCMRSFQTVFGEFLEDGGNILEIEIGLGARGEWRYPSLPAKEGTGHFQCYDKYLRKSLEQAAEASGCDLAWGRPPETANFFSDGGQYDSEYGRFFLKWYSQVLINHGDMVLEAANTALDGASTTAKLSGMHWWYKTASCAVEWTSGFDHGYGSVASMLRMHEAGLNFTCVNPEGFVWEILNAAWDVDAIVSCENAFPCYDRQGYRKILEVAKPKNETYGRCVSAFNYHGLNQTLFEQPNLTEFELFVKKMHGEFLTGSTTIVDDDDMTEADKRDMDQNQCGSSGAAGSKKRKSSMALV